MVLITVPIAYLLLENVSIGKVTYRYGTMKERSGLSNNLLEKNNDNACDLYLIIRYLRILT